MNTYTSFRIVETDNHLAVHCLTWSVDRGQKWIRETGARFFPGLSFAVQGKSNGEWLTIITNSI